MVQKNKEIRCAACGHVGNDFHLLRAKQEHGYSIWAPLSSGTNRRKCKLYGCPFCGTVRMEFDEGTITPKASVSTCSRGLINKKVDV